MVEILRSEAGDDNNAVIEESPKEDSSKRNQFLAEQLQSANQILEEYADQTISDSTLNNVQRLQKLSDRSKAQGKDGASEIYQNLADSTQGYLDIIDKFERNNQETDISETVSLLAKIEKESQDPTYLEKLQKQHEAIYKLAEENQAEVVKSTIKLFEALESDNDFLGKSSKEEVEDA